MEGWFRCMDFLCDELPGGLFDIVIAKDIMEHIAPERKEQFLRRVQFLLRPDGIAFFGFPAWQMPFGGHQQTCRKRLLSMLPWIHLLPLQMYRGLLWLFREPEDHILELMDIRASRVTVEAFEHLCKVAGFKVLDRTLWLINPHYRVKFGLHPMRLRLGVDQVPRLRNYLASSCFYVLKNDRIDK